MNTDSKAIYNLYENFDSTVTSNNNAAGYTGDLRKDVEVFYHNNPHLDSTRPVVDWLADHDFTISPLNWLKKDAKYADGIQVQYGIFISKDFDMKRGGLFKMPLEKAVESFNKQQMGWEHYPEHMIRFRVVIDSDRLPMPGTEDDIATSTRDVASISTEMEEWRLPQVGSWHSSVPDDKMWRGSSPFTHSVKEHFTKLYETQDPGWEKILETLEKMERSFQRETRGKRRSRGFSL